MKKAKLNKRIKIILAILLIFVVLKAFILQNKFYPLKINNITAYVEVAQDAKSRRRGLMFRKKLPENSGMLFVFRKSKYLSFWMKNTQIPLSIAFIDKNFQITQIEDMYPERFSGGSDLIRKVYKSKKKSKYALEMEQGWFRKNNIKIGDKVIFSHKLMRKLKFFKDKVQ